MIQHLGDFAEDETIYIYFNTYTSNDPSASSTITDFINTDVHIHKDGGLTQRNNAAGITVSVDFDGITGTHLIQIDTSDNTVAGFWVTGSDYMVRIEGTAIDGATINAGVATFSIENRFQEVDVTKILGHLLTQTGTQVADGFEKFFDVGTPTGTVNSLPGAVPDGAGGLVISDAGGFAIDTIAGSDDKVVISTDAQDLSATLDVNTKTITAGIIANASFNSDVGSTVYASNIIALAVRKVLDELNLDHLMKVVTAAADMTTEIVDNSALSRILSNGDTSAFVPSTDGLQLIRDAEPHGTAMRGTDGANTTVPDAAGVAPTAVENRQEMDSNSTQLSTIATDVAGLDGRAINVGYADGAVWIDTSLANTNTVSYVDGTADNPVSTIAAATTIAGNLNLKRFNLVAGSSITLAQAYDNYIFDNYHATIALGGQSVNNAIFNGGVITGNDDGSNTSPTQYCFCFLSGNTLGQFVFTDCYISGTITLAEAGTYRLHNCLSATAGAGSPNLDFGAGLAASQVNMRNYSGGIEIENMGAGAGTYNMSLEGQGQLIINANCSATSNVMLRGNFDLTDNSGGAVTVNRDDDSANIIDVQSRIPAALVSGRMSSDVVAVSGDTTAADNLESQYDTTGLAGDTFPATQAQLGGIANVGSAVNITPDSYTLTTGTQSSGTVASVAALDGTNHEHTDTAGAMDLYYEFIIGAGVPTSVTITGYLNNNNDDLEVLGYDWVASAWVQIGTLAGKNQATNEVDSYELFVNMVGSGANEGIVRVRFTDGAFTLTTATLAIDQIFISFSLAIEGYDNGSVWIDTTASNTNTVVGIDGTARNPVSTIAAANTLLASTNLNRLEVAPGSSITFAASQDSQVFHGENWTLALGGQSVSATHIIGATVTGICTGASKPTFENCHFGAVTMPPCHLEGCTLEGTFTIGSAGDFALARCQSGVPGTGTPILDFGAALNSSEVGFRGYSGGIEVQNMGTGTGTYLMTLEGEGQLIINANCSATSSIELRGNFRVTDNASGAVVVTTDDDTTDINAVLVDTNEMQGKLPTNNIMGSSVVTDKDDEIDAIKAATDNLPNSGSLNDLATILVDTNELQGDWTNGGRLDLLLDAIKAVTDLLPDAGALNDLATILVDTNELQTDWTNAGRLDIILDAIKAVTDLLPNAGALTDIDTGVNNIEAKLPSKAYLTGTANVDGDVQMDEATGNFPGSVASVVANVTVGGIVAAALADMFDTDSGTNYAAAVAGSVVKEIADNAGGSALTEAGIADAVWDEAKTGHTGDLKTMADNLDQSISSLNDPTAAAIATAVMAETIDGTLDVTDSLKILLGLAIAKQVDKAGNVYTYKDQAGATVITLTVGANSTTAVIA